MARQVGEETRDELLAAAAAAGYTVTRDQLQHWQSRAIGVLPPPRIESLGRHGTTVYYPGGTAAQLIAVCQLLARTHSLKVVKLELWWLGFPAQPRIRAVLQVCINNLKRTRDHFVETVHDRGLDGTEVHYDQFTDQLFSLFDRLKTKRLKPPLSSVRGRVGRDRMSSFLYMLLDALLLDALPPAAREDFGLRDVGLGLASSLGASLARPDLSDDAARLAPYRFLSRTCKPGALQVALDATTDAELLTARDEARGFVALLDSLTGGGLSPKVLMALGLQQQPTMPPLGLEDRMYLFCLFLSWRREDAFRQLVDTTAMQLLEAALADLSGTAGMEPANSARRRAYE